MRLANATWRQATFLQKLSQIQLFLHRLLPTPLQPKRTTLIKMNGKTCVFTTAQDVNPAIVKHRFHRNIPLYLTALYLATAGSQANQVSNQWSLGAWPRNSQQLFVVTLGELINSPWRWIQLRLKSARLAVYSDSCHYAKLTSTVCGSSYLTPNNLQVGNMQTWSRGLVYIYNHVLISVWSPETEAQLWFHLIRMSPLNLQREQIHYVSPPHLYSSPERTNQTPKGILHFHFLFTVLEGKNEATSIQLCATFNLSFRCH